MFRKPPTKLEQLQDALSHTLETLQDTIDALPLDRVKDARDSAAESVVYGLKAARHRAGDAGSHAAAAGRIAGRVAASRASDAFSSAADALSQAAVTARQAAHAARENAASAASSAATVASSAAATGAQAASSVAGKVGESAHEVVGKAHEVVGKAGESAGHARESVAHAASQTAHVVAEKAHAATEMPARLIQTARTKGRRSTDDAAREAIAIRQNARDRIVESRAEVSIEESSSKWLWIGLGILAGAALIIFLAPGAGRRNRALVKGKLKQAGDKAGDVARRTAGAIHERTSGNQDGGDDADDTTISDRVRTTLGENDATRNLERLNVDCVHGIVTLRGPMVDGELLAQIEAIVRGVKGVQDVRSEMLLDETSDDSPTFVG